MTKVLTRIIIALAFGLLPLLMAVPAYATADPDSTPTISNIKANTYLVTSGDVLIYGDYEIPYATVPDDPADETYFLQLIDTDGTTVLGSDVPFVMMDSGYNKGCFGFYFPDGVDWEEAYTIRIAQNPAKFDDPKNYDYVMTPVAWSSQTTQSANQLEMATNIINMAQRLESYYEDYTFVESTAGGTVLSAPTGETYFRGVIYGIQVMAPSIFLVQVASLEDTGRTWTTTQFTAYEERWAGTWVETGANATASQFDVTPQTALGLGFTLPLVVGAIILSSIKFKKSEPGFIVASLLIIMAALMGWAPTAIFAATLQTMGIYLGYVFFYSRG